MSVENLYLEAQRPWWHDLDDAFLSNLVQTGTQDATDIRIAQERILTARIALAQAGRPVITGDALEAGVRLNTVPGTSSDITSQLGLAPALELDIFNRSDARERFAAETLQASIYDAALVRLNLQLAIAELYVEIRLLDALIEKRTALVAGNTRLVSLARVRLREGGGSAQALRQAEAALFSNRMDNLDLERARARSMGQLAALVLMDRHVLERAFAQASAEYRVPYFEDAPDLPAALLRNRPDVLAAEARVRAAAARLDISEDALRPSLQLQGVLQIGGSGLISFGPRLQIPVFNWPTLRAERAQTASQLRVLELEWQQTVRDSVQDIKTAFQSMENLQEKLREAKGLQNAAASSAAIIQTGFEEGEVALDEVVEARQALARAEERLLQTEHDLLIAWMQLQVATGRGWHAVTDPA